MYGGFTSALYDIATGHIVCGFIQKQEWPPLPPTSLVNHDILSLWVSSQEWVTTVNLSASGSTASLRTDAVHSITCCGASVTSAACRVNSAQGIINGLHSSWYIQSLYISGLAVEAMAEQFGQDVISVTSEADHHPGECPGYKIFLQLTCYVLYHCVRHIVQMQYWSRPTVHHVCKMCVCVCVCVCVCHCVCVCVRERGGGRGRERERERESSCTSCFMVFRMLLFPHLLLPGMTGIKIDLTIYLCNFLFSVLCVWKLRCIYV